MIMFLMIVLLLLAVFLIMVILVQRGRGAGLAGAFGAGGGSSSAFGTKTGDVFTTVTVITFAVFMLLSIWLSFLFKWRSQEIKNGTPPAVSVTLPAEAAPGGLLPGADVTPEVEKPATAPAAATVAAPATAPGTAPSTNP
jgi:preprotein translocase subunit SecG